ncbi:MAG: tRNA (adenosine(37)-N6)-dimethylallyltransferase MiaA [Bacillota bacterium]
MQKYINNIENTDSNKIPLIIILGPTAVGKTNLSLNLAKNLNAEIISADSMQIYKEMDIGTAKVEKSVRENIPHHMIDIISPEDDFSVADYQKKADKIINNLINNNKVPLMVGGTGLYINAVVDGFMLPDMEADEKLRNKLRKKAKKYGNEYVHNILKDIDPKLANKLHPNDLRRVIRGIEIYEITGKTKSYFKKKQEEREARYNALKIALTRDREELYKRINQRVDDMIKNGLVEEVKKLKKKYNLSKTSLQALGYKEIINYLEDEYNLEEAKRIIKRDTRHYAKKQITFFNRDEKINWFNLSNLEEKEVLQKTKKLIINKYSE